MSEYFRFLDNDEEDSESGHWVTLDDAASDEIIIEYKNFDCPTDEVIVKSTTCGVTRRRSGGGVVRTPSPSPPAQVPSATQPQEEVIVIPASADTLQQAIQQVTANGVTVLDVRSLGGSSGHSSPSSSEPQVTVVQAAEGHHYIAVTGSAPQSYASLSNALAEGDGGGVGYHVQYVEPQELYTQSHQGQGQVSYSLYSGVNEGSNNFSPGGSSTTGQWYGSQPTSHHYLISGTPTGQETVNTIHRTSPQTVSAEVSYLNTSHPSGQDEGAGVQAGHAARTSPATVSQFTVQWLLENYETAEGVSLPRSTLYNHYLRHCSQRELEPVNAASFGKLIRSVFMGLRTRRLGTRGNSKYHYYGIRVKPGSSLSSSGFDGGSNGNKASSGRCLSGARGGSVGGGAGVGSGQVRLDEQATNSHMHQHQQYLGDGSGAIPNFPEIHFTQPLPGDCSHEDVDTLRSIYREHCEAFLDAVLSLELSTVESLWREFWRQNNNNDSDECEEEKYLSKTKLYQLCAMSEVQTWVRNVDVNFYQRLVQVLLPDVLRPIPSPLTQAIRNFAKGLESWLVGAMSGCPAGMIRAKTSPAAALAQSLRRYTSLNHLAQAARAVLHNSHQIQQMLADLNRVDFHNVQEQASWVCQCPSEVVSELEADFKRTLQRQASLEQWASWLEAAVKRALRPHEGFQDYAHHARQFLLKWSFYSSMVIRDLTLRSAASFGSFHLIRLLYDEYMFYLIEHHVAEHQGSAPIQVMAGGEREGVNGNVEEEEDQEGEPEDDDFVAASVCIKTEEVPSKKMKIS